MTDSVPMSIEIGESNGPAYKSIRHVIWNDIPPFAVLTGRNGTGKTQFLEALAHKIAGSSPHDSLLDSMKLEIKGAVVHSSDVVYIPSNWGIGDAPPLGLAEMRDAKTQLWGQYRQHSPADISHQRRREQLSKAIGKQIDTVSAEEFARRLPDDFSFMIDEANVILGLTHVFVGYRTQTLRDREIGKSDLEIISKYGKPPWDLLNEVLAVADFPYRVNTPVGTDLLAHFHLKLSDYSGVPIQTSALSSGEAAILQVVLWLYYSQHHGRFAKIMLLDEPDAHLHPAMTRQFINVVKDVLVEKYGVRVILATHSPSTVALAPADSIFEMKKGISEIQKVPSKSHAIGLLTAGIITVGPGTKYVFLEDQSDIEFYSVIRDLLCDFGPARDKMALEPAPTIVFLPASTGQGQTKIAGGCGVVRSWVDKFSGSPLESIFSGIIDRDVGNSPSASVHVIARYSIENYLLDPINVFVALLEAGLSPALKSFTVKLGDESLLKTFTEGQLQEIVDAIADRVTAHLQPNLPKGMDAVRVDFTNGITLSYPRWMLDTRGHDLLPIYQSAFNAQKFITPPKMILAIQRVRLIPKDLAVLLRALQN